MGPDARLDKVVASGATKLKRDLGLTTVGELLTHYPRRYLSIEQVSSTADLREGEVAMVVATVRSAAVKPYRDRRTGHTAYRTEVVADLADGTIATTFFDRRVGAAQWRTRQLVPGTRALLSGRFERNRYRDRRWELVHPEVDEDIDRQPGLKPVYPLAGKTTSRDVERSVRAALAVIDRWPDLLPAEVRERHGLLEAWPAVVAIHTPPDWPALSAARQRLRFDEAYVAQVALALRRARARAVSTRPRSGRAGGLLDAFDARLPFALTYGQRRVEAEIAADLAREHPMRRLLQGEVGSGKTVVALRAMLRVIDSGGQAALLAPTEVLVQQHQRSLTALLGDLAEGGLLGGAEAGTRVVQLTGSMPAASRRAALLQAASGEAGIVVGTHALLEDQVQFADLGLVVVDEQHRFGVEQRAALTAKGQAPPHELVMTATPIPRTVAMTVFGDLETSALTELPAGRRPVQTTVVPLAEQPGWLDRVWARVREEVAAGRQAYVVCPRISAEDTEELPWDGEDEGEDAPQAAARRPAAAVEEVGPALASGPLAGLRVVELHGRLGADEKDLAMRRFADARIDVLVSTTVVEVGVDVANATTMVILDADRFGISQLHQLRGRVGRGGQEGLCLLVTSQPAASAARERLDAVASTADGFRLAELDAQLRREGDVMGRRQSGRSHSLRLLSVLRDAEVITAAREEAGRLVAADPELADHPDLRGAVARLEAQQQADFLEKV